MYRACLSFHTTLPPGESEPGFVHRVGLQGVAELERELRAAFRLGENETISGFFSKLKAEEGQKFKSREGALRFYR